MAAPDLTITRLFEAQGGTFGRLSGRNGLELYTVERQWLDNKPFVSCVPIGDYTLERHSTDRHRRTWALVGRTVSHFGSDAKPRYACLFHSANLPRQINGCVGPGTGLGLLNGNEIAAVNSVAAMTRFRQYLANADRPRLSIVNGPTFPKG